MTRPAEDLRRLDEALSAFPDDDAGLAGVALMRASLERRREELVEVLSNQALGVALSRPLRRGTGGELKLVAGVLASLQDSLSSIAQTFRGRPTARGVIPTEIIESVELRVAAAVPGSLRLSLTPAFPETQTPLFEDAEESALDLSVGRLLAVLRGADETPAGVLENLPDLGPRAMTHIQTLAKTLADASADVTFDWRSPRSSATVILTSDRAGRLREILDAVEEHERTAVFTGRLAGGSLIRATFELELDDGSVIRGTVDGTILGDVEDLFGQTCAATIVTTELRLQSGETREAHRLTHLTP